jgi:hypothetical protein
MNKIILQSYGIKGVYTDKEITVLSTDIKGKAIPLQTWTGPEGSRKLRFPDFKTINT